MAQKDIRLSGSALALRRFTADDLARASDCKLATARSWIQRNKLVLEEHAQQPLKGRGRPLVLWRLRDEGAKALRDRLDGFQLDSMVERLVVGHPEVLSDVEQQLEAWRLAKRLDLPSAEAEHTALRQLIRVAWDDFSSLFANTGKLRREHLATIAEFEREAGGGATPDSDDLKDVAVWLGRSLSRMSERDVDDEFAAHVLRLRADVRAEADRIKVTAAAFAAAVWSDEDLAGIDVSAEIFVRCAKVADLVGADVVVEQVSSAIGGTYGYCGTSSDVQAVLCGLIQVSRFKRTTQVWGLLESARIKTFWVPEIAPVALFGLSDAPGIQWNALVKLMADEARRALQNAPRNPGRLRAKPIDFSKVVLDADQVGPLGSDGLDRVAKAYSYRPAALPILQLA